MSMDILQEKIRKMKCPIVLDLSVQMSQIPACVQESSDQRAFGVYCK